MSFQRRRLVTGDQGQLLRTNNIQEPLQGTGDGKDTMTESLEAASAAASWKRILLLIVAVTIHNIPGTVPISWIL